MAVVAIDAVVNVAANASMICVGLRLGMAVGAGEDGVITRISVAGRAHTISSTVIQREIRVIPVRGNPRGCVVARGTGGWEPCRCVIRTGRAVVIGFVARIAVRRQARVVVANVALCARDLDVVAGERKRCCVVVERRRYPGAGVVAYLALLRES